jgi:hypothetical protein
LPELKTITSTKSVLKDMSMHPYCGLGQLEELGCEHALELNYNITEYPKKRRKKKRNEVTYSYGL